MHVKSFLRFPVDIRRAHRLLNSKPAAIHGCTERPIALDLRGTDLLFDCGRHLASLAQWARDCGSPFYLRCGALLLAAIARKIHGAEFLQQPHVSWIAADASIPNAALVLCDYQPDLSSGMVRMMIGRDIDRNVPVMPYPMHPHTHPYASPTSLARLRRAVVRSGILFAGNQKPKYGHPKIHLDFGVMSRLDILSTVGKEFASRVVHSTKIQRTADQIVISDSRSESIAPSDWLPTLAAAKFFLCCPGVAQPTCHNLIESMSVGTIPIIEYGDRITPKLVDGQTAICFRGKSGLVDAIRRADSMPPGQVRDLSRRVAAFYDDHLCGAKFMRELCEQPLDQRNRRICMPFHDSNFYGSDPTVQHSAAA